MTINPKAEKTINEIYSKVNIEDYNIKISDKNGYYMSCKSISKNI